MSSRGRLVRDEQSPMSMTACERWPRRRRRRPVDRELDTGAPAKARPPVDAVIRRGSGQAMTVDR